MSGQSCYRTQQPGDQSFMRDEGVLKKRPTPPLTATDTAAVAVAEAESLVLRVRARGFI